LDRHQIANIALDEVGWMSISSDATRRQNHWSVLVVLEDCATEQVSALNGVTLDCSWKGDDTSKSWWKEVLLRGGRPEWRASVWGNGWGRLESNGRLASAGCTAAQVRKKAKHRPLL